MPLTYNQKQNVKTLFGVLTVICVIGGIVFGVFCLVTWSDTATSVQHFCVNRTGFTIVTTHGNGQNVNVTYNDPRCK